MQRNKQILNRAASGEKFTSLAKSFSISKQRVSEIIIKESKKVFPAEEKINYLTAKGIIENYASQILQYSK